jgi:hypothetical protein
MLRSEGLIEYQNGPIENMSYLFDLEMFDARLRESCPLLALYEDLRELEKHGRQLARIGRPRDLPWINDQMMTPKAWAEQNLQGDGKITVIDYPLIMGQTYADFLFLAANEKLTFLCKGRYVRTALNSSPTLVGFSKCDQTHSFSQHMPCPKCQPDLNFR